MKGVRTGTGGDVGGADLTGRRAARSALLRQARLVGGRHNCGLRAVGDAAKVAGEAGRQLEVEVTEKLVAIITIELQAEVGKGPGDRLRGSCDQPRMEGTFRSRTQSATGRGVEAEDLTRFLVRKHVVPGEEMRSDFIDRAVRGCRHQAAVGGEEVELKIVEGHLGEVFEVDGQLPAAGIRPDRSNQLRVDPEAGGDEEEAIL